MPHEASIHDRKMLNLTPKEKKQDQSLDQALHFLA